MKRRAPHGFTLIEMITVVAIIIVLVGLVVSVFGFVQNKAAKTRALGEIKAMEGACESYKTDNGTYPKTDDTDLLDPRVDVSPTSARYTKASLALYSALSGDLEPVGAPDYKVESGNRAYLPFKPSQLSATLDNNKKIVTVRGLQDPFGNTYGYSTAANQLEVEYREALRKDPKAPHPADLKGYNPTFDLWSTSGGTTISQQVKWVKNWGE